MNFDGTPHWENEDDELGAFKDLYSCVAKDSIFSQSSSVCI